LPGTCLGYGFFEGTTLHGYGESLFNKWECRRLTSKTRFVEDLQELTSKYVLAKTELLVYSLELRMGQVDLLMRNEDSRVPHSRLQIH
jgi:hypothetical protein